MTKSTTAILVGGALVITVLVCVTLLLLHGSEDVTSWLLAGIAGLAALVGQPLTHWLLKDSDGDGTPDVIDDDQPEK